MGHYRKKHQNAEMPDERLIKAVKEKAKNGEIPCAVAHALAKELGVSPEQIGFTMDILDIPIVKCQLGLFGYKDKKKIIKPKKEVSEQLKDKIYMNLEQGRLPCKKAWEIAKKLNIGKMEVASACEALGIKIIKCQLGAF